VRVIDVLARCVRIVRRLGQGDLAEWLADRREALSRGSRSPADVFAELHAVDFAVVSASDFDTPELDARLGLVLLADVIHQLTRV